MTGQIGILSGSVTRATVAPRTSQSCGRGGSATNPIVLENQKPGNPESEWGINGAGSSNIEGFATDISVNRGQTVNFKIKRIPTTIGSNLSDRLLRRHGRRKVATIQHTGLQNQPNPLHNPPPALVDAGNWAVSASWAVPGGRRLGRLHRQARAPGRNRRRRTTSRSSSATTAARATSSSRPADTTWQAYNGWGGANSTAAMVRRRAQGAGRAYAVSYNRPIATRGGVGLAAGPQDYLFGVEYAAICWLEQNGYDVTYMAGVDADRYGSLLLNHKCISDVGHDEYWSGQQRTNVEAARDAGVNLRSGAATRSIGSTRWGNA